MNKSLYSYDKSGSAIEHDAFVEAEIVQPLKNYVSGKEFHSFMAENDEYLAHISVLVPLCTTNNTFTRTILIVYKSSAIRV